MRNPVEARVVRLESSHFIRILNLPRAGCYGGYGLTVMTAGCGPANLGSIPSSHPRTGAIRFFLYNCALLPYSRGNSKLLKKMKNKKNRTVMAVMLIAVQISFVASYILATRNFLGGTMIFLWGTLILSLSFKFGSWIAGRRFLTLQQKREIISLPLFGSVPEMLVLSFTEEPNWIWALLFGLVLFRVFYLLSPLAEFCKRGMKVSVPKEKILERVRSRINSDPELNALVTLRERFQHEQALQRIARAIPFSGLEETIFLRGDLCDGIDGIYRKIDCLSIEKQYAVDTLVDQRALLIFLESKRVYVDQLERKLREDA